MRKTLVILLGLLALLVPFAAGAATDATNATATPWVYDPDNTGTAVSFWNTTGDTPILKLQKNAPTETNSAAGATVEGFAGNPLFQLSFEVKGYCNNGAPRFNVYSGTSTFFFGCALGAQTDLGDGWTLVEMNCEQPGAEGSCGNEGLVTIDGIDLVQDEQGRTKLRNIMVDGVLVGPPPVVQQVAQVNREGYCSPTPRRRAADGSLGIFLDLLGGQGAVDPNYLGSTPAKDYGPGIGISCDNLPGYHFSGQYNGDYPVYIK